MKNTRPGKPPSEPNVDRRSSEPPRKPPSEPNVLKSGSEKPPRPGGESFKGTKH